MYPIEDAGPRDKRLGIGIDIGRESERQSEIDEGGGVVDRILT
jgi:hypothetical protein